MITDLLAIPVLIVAAMLQMVVISRMPLLGGSADLMLLLVVAWGLLEEKPAVWIWALVAGGLVSFLSALPIPVGLLSYLIAMALARVLQRRIWQSPLLAMLVVTLIATLIQHLLSIVVLQFGGANLPFSESVQVVALPSTLLNMFLALPVYALMNDLHRWIHPSEVRA